MTQLIYFPDVESCYIKEFDATITRASAEGVILDRTAFYPTGGGQLHDTGILEINDKTYNVVDVKKMGNEVLHILDGEVEAKPGDGVHGIIDWDRRYGNMRMHTAQHLISAIIYDLYGSTTVGNQLYPDRARIDFSPLTKDQLDVEEVERIFAQKVSEALEVIIYHRPRDELLSDSRVRVNLDRIPKLATELRIVEIDGYDICPCAGTHVRSLGELAPIKIVKTKSKGSGRLRVEYVFEE